MLIGAGALYVVVSSAGGFADSVGALGSARPGWLAAGVVAEAASYVALGFMLRCLAGDRVSRRAGVRLGLVVAGLGNILPAAPAEGLTMASAELRRRGVGARRTSIALGLMQWISVRMLFGVAAIDALVLAVVAGVGYPQFGLDSGALALLALAVLALLGITGWLASRRQTMELVALVAGRVRFWQPRLAASQHRSQGAAWHGDIHEVLQSTRTKWAFGGLALISFLADATCFRCALTAVGVHPLPGLLLFAYAAAMIASLAPFVPAGLGIVEVVVPALLHNAGVPLDVALAGVLGYRAMATLLPALSGTVALIRLHMTDRVPAPFDGAAPSDGST